MGKTKRARRSPDQIGLDPRTGERLFGQRPVGQMQTAQSATRLQALCALAQAVYAVESLQEILQRAVDFLQALLGPERCIVGVFGADQEPACVCSKGVDASGPVGQWPVSQNILARVRQEYVALLSSDTQTDEALRDFKSVEALGIRSVLCVPLGSREQVRGVVYLDCQLRSKAFTQDDLLFLTALCRMLDLAIHRTDQLQEARARAALSAEHARQLRAELFRRHKIVGTSSAIVQAFDKLKRLASAPLPLLLVGETGTGKEMFARAAHFGGARAGGPFVVAHLAAANPNLIESELFGHERGAFTGATQQRIGVIERAHRGTLFLDEVARLSPETQLKLLRAVEQKEFCRVGGSETIRSDFRLVTATTADLEAMKARGQFLPDLYYRLAGAVIRLPALRDRQEDIPLLVRHFLEQEGVARRFSSGALRALEQYPWPSNVRELRSAILAIIWTSDADPVQSEHVRQYLERQAATAQPERFVPLAERLAQIEREHIVRALQIAGGNKNRAMELLGMARGTFFERLKRYRL